MLYSKIFIFCFLNMSLLFLLLLLLFKLLLLLKLLSLLLSNNNHFLACLSHLRILNKNMRKLLASKKIVLAAAASCVLTAYLSRIVLLCAPVIACHIHMPSYYTAFLPSLSFQATSVRADMKICALHGSQGQQESIIRERRSIGWPGQPMRAGSYFSYAIFDMKCAVR